MIAAHLKGIFIFLTVLLCCKDTFSQARSIPLRDALKQVTKVYGTQFVFDPELIDGKKSSIEVVNNKKSVEEILKEILYPNDLVFLYIKSNYYSIVSKGRVSSTSGAGTSASDQNNVPHNSPNLGASAMDKAPSASGQANLTGRVTDEKNNPLSGVSITMNGKNIGASTNEEGKFSLNVSSLKGTLAFSYVGYTRQDVAIDGRTSLEVQLQPATTALNEVVVVGYGTQKKVNLTGAVSQISSKQLEDRPVQNMTKALQGQIPNVNITFGSGKPGTEGTINIRGTTSINGGAPLVLIDGVPGNIDRINPLDVETVSVLKDASASAIYGARGSFGVVLVTTKRAKSGKATVNYSTNFGWGTQTTSTNFMTSGYEQGRIMDTADLRTLGVNYMGYTEQDYDELLKRANDKTEDPSR